MHRLIHVLLGDRRYKIYPILRERHLLEEDGECIELIEWFVDRTHLHDEIGDTPTPLPQLEESALAAESSGDVRAE